MTSTMAMFFISTCLRTVSETIGDFPPKNQVEGFITNGDQVIEWKKARLGVPYGSVYVWYFIWCVITLIARQGTAPFMSVRALQHWLKYLGRVGKTYHYWGPQVFHVASDLVSPQSQPRLSRSICRRTVCTHSFNSGSHKLSCTTKLTWRKSWNSTIAQKLRIETTLACWPHSWKF